MKKFAAFLMMFALVSSMSLFAQEAAAPAPAEEVPAIETEESNEWIPYVLLGADWASSYMCDGKVGNPDPMAFLWAETGLKGFRLGIWSAIDLTEYNNPDHSGAYKNDREYRPEEIDYEIGYGYTFKKLPVSDLTLDIAWKYFQYPRALFGHDNPLDMKIYLDNVLRDITDEDSKWSLGTGVTFRYDLDKYTWYGWYDVTVGYQFCDKLSGALSTKLYWGTKSKMRAAYGLNRDCVSSLLVRGDLSYALCNNVSVGIWGEAGYAVDHEIRQDWKADTINNEENFRVGASVSLSF